MKASELITALEAAIEKHGDLEVQATPAGGYWPQDAVFEFLEGNGNFNREEEPIFYIGAPE